MLRTFALVSCSLLLCACGAPSREAFVAVLPETESGSYPEQLDEVEVSASEWKQIVLERKAKPCDRRSKYVGDDGLSDLREALQTASRKGFDVECDEERVTLTIDGKKLDMDFVRAEVGSDAKGKGARFQALSTKTGLLVEGLIHKREEARDGVVQANIRRYLPGQVGAIYYWQSDDRYEIFITAGGKEAAEGIYVVAPIWDGDDLRAGIARFKVTKD
jgi:hypothetical protein